LTRRRGTGPIPLGLVGTEAAFRSIIVLRRARWLGLERPPKVVLQFGLAVGIVPPRPEGLLPLELHRLPEKCTRLTTVDG
jgi:hypothetical protein